MSTSSALSKIRLTHTSALEEQSQLDATTSREDIARKPNEHAGSSPAAVDEDVSAPRLQLPTRHPPSATTTKSESARGDPGCSGGGGEDKDVVGENGKRKRKRGGKNSKEVVAKDEVEKGEEIEMEKENVNTKSKARPRTGATKARKSRSKAALSSSADLSASPTDVMTTAHQKDASPASNRKGKGKANRRTGAKTKRTGKEKRSLAAVRAIADSDSDSPPEYESEQDMGNYPVRHHKKPRIDDTPQILSASAHAKTTAVTAPEALPQDVWNVASELFFFQASNDAQSQGARVEPGLRPKETIAPSTQEWESAWTMMELAAPRVGI